MPPIAAQLQAEAASLRQLHGLGHGLAGADLARHAEQLEQWALALARLERFHEEVARDVEASTAMTDLDAMLRAGGRVS